MQWKFERKYSAVTTVRFHQFCCFNTVFTWTKNIERDFSINSDALQTNMSAKILIARGIIYDGIRWLRLTKCSLDEIFISKVMLQHSRASCTYKVSSVHGTEKNRSTAAELNGVNERKRKANLFQNQETQNDWKKSKQEFTDNANALAHDAERMNDIKLLTKLNALRKRADELTSEVILRKN